ncbi:MAG: TRAP transporter large permease subunit, partial [Burkholderiaceae bacterium]|nr:TRAP transporter large permease subunit [Burkholderiaceae bacterium]
PMLAPVAEKMGIDLVWFGILLAMNMQTSFLTPPFGFALFYLRSVAARKDYTDEVTKERIPAVKTTQIYKGSIAFIILQLIMVAVIMFNPELVSGGITQTKKLSAEAVENLLDAPVEDYGSGTGTNDNW